MRITLYALLALTLVFSIPAIAQDGQRKEADGVIVQNDIRVLPAVELQQVLARPAVANTDWARAALAQPVDEVGDAVEEVGGELTEEGGEELAVVDDQPAPPVVDEIDPGTMRFYLMDGSVLTGTLAVDSIPVETEFGRLIVPIDSISSFAPGLNAHPAMGHQIDTLIQQLASPNAAERDRAQGELAAFGPGLIFELQQHENDPDAERKLRIAAILEDLYGQQNDPMMEEQVGQAALTRLDQIVTDGFTIAGSIAIDTFEIQSKFGMLTVTLADIKTAGRVTSAVAETRRTIEVSGADFAGRNYKSTGIRLNRGDRVIIRAEGRITMSPWGNNVQTGPDGMPQNGMYVGNIPMGALAGRIGDGGDEMMIGANQTFTAQRAGTLQLGFAMQPNWHNHNFPGKFTVRVRVVPAQ